MNYIGTGISQSSMPRYAGKEEDMYASDDNRIIIFIIKKQIIKDFVFDELLIHNRDCFKRNRGLATTALNEFRRKYLDKYPSLYGFSIFDDDFFEHYAKRNNLQSKKLKKDGDELILYKL